MSFEFIDSSTAWLNEAAGVDFSIHGWIAFLVGGICVAALNIGLMWLVVRSNRQGHDTVADEVGQTTGHHKVVKEQ